MNTKTMTTALLGLCLTVATTSKSLKADSTNAPAIVKDDYIPTIYRNYPPN